MSVIHHFNLAAADLNLLVVFDALMNEQHLTRAAEKIGLSQPATSNALARLRKLMNYPAHHSDGRGFRLFFTPSCCIEPVCLRVFVVELGDSESKEARSVPLAQIRLTWAALTSRS